MITMKDVLKNFWGHLKTITKHRHAVIRHCFKVGIGFQGLFHDLSKYSPVEFLVGIKYYRGYKSPNDVERAKHGYSTAWLHHQGRNKHHFEFWRDYDVETHLVAPVRMPMRYIKEMFCDRLAASKIYMGENYTESHPIEYFRGGKAKEIAHPESMAILEEWLLMLAEKGEEETLRYIKNVK